MAQYIDKDALLAKLVGRLNKYKKEYNEMARYEIWETAKELDHKINELEKTVNLIDTLEVKEVDLEKEINHWQGCEAFPEGVNITPLPKAMDIVERTAKHFFELGLKAQQNISIDITNIDKVIEENGVDPNSKEAKMFKESYYMALEKLKTQKGE